MQRETSPAISRNRQRGLSMVELMVALLLSSVLLLGVLQIFDTNKQSSRVANALSRVQESGRIATEMLARDIRMADYWGCAPDTGAIENHLDSTHADYDTWMEFANAAGVSGSNDVAAGTPPIGTIPVKSGTDTLTLRGSRRANVKIVHSVPANAAVIQITSGVDIPQGQIILISDCNQADIFGNTHANTSVGGNIGHHTGASGGGMNEEKDLSKSYDRNAQILLPYKTRYFIGQPETDVWSLYREQNGSVSELVRDVQDMQIVYGEDTDDDGSADVFTDAGSVSDMDGVISIRVTLEASSVNSASGTPLTRSYSVTGNIRNRSL